MPTANFRIGNLTFSYESESLKKLIKIQDLIGEFHEGEKALRTASGVDEVTVVHDSNEGGEYMRLQAFDYPEKWTIDISPTKPDNPNPIGMYLDSEKPIQYYNYETEEEREIPRKRSSVLEGEATPAAGQPQGDGTMSQGRPTQEPSPNEPTSEKASKSSEESAAGGNREVDDKREIPDGLREAGRQLQNRAVMLDNEAQVANVRLESGAVVLEKLRSYVEYIGRSEAYLSRVVNVLGKTSPKALTVGEFPDIMELLWDPSLLAQRENQ